MQEHIAFAYMEGFGQARGSQDSNDDSYGIKRRDTFLAKYIAKMFNDPKPIKHKKQD